MDYLTKLANNPDPGLDIPNHVSSLTKREVMAVQKSWDEVAKLGVSTVGIALFDL